MVVPVPAIAPGFIVQVPLAGSPLNVTLPVAAAHDAGWVIVPTTGDSGAEGAAMILTLTDGTDIHPASLVTLKLYVPGIRFDIVRLVPVPVILPGLTVHVPVEGRPVNTTVPVGVEHAAG